MSLLLVDSKPIFGGGQRMLTAIAAALPEWNPCIVRPEEAPERPTVYGVQVRTLTFPHYPAQMTRPANLLPLLPAVTASALALSRLMLKHRVRAVIANDAYALIPLSLAAKITGVPVIAYIHSCDLPLRAATLMRTCRGVIACSAAAARALPGTHPRVRVVPNVVQVPVEWIGAALREPRDTWVLGFAGRIDANKNLAGLISAFAAARPTLEASGPVRLEILGTGEGIADLQALARRLAVEDHIHWLGWSADPLERMVTWDALALPSHMEAHPLVLQEAQWLGVAVMGTNRGGMPELINDGQTGILARSPEPGDLAEALIRLRRTGRGLATEALARVRVTGDPALYGQRLRDVLEEWLA